MSYWLGYYAFVLLGSLESFLQVFVICYVLALVAAVCVGIVVSGSYMEDERAVYKKYVSYLKSKVVIALFLLAVFLPSKKDAVIMTGLYLSENQINASFEYLNTIMPDLGELLRETIKKEIGEIKKGNEK